MSWLQSFDLSWYNILACRCGCNKHPDACLQINQVPTPPLSFRFTAADGETVSLHIHWRMDDCSPRLVCKTPNCCSS